VHRLSGKWTGKSAWHFTKRGGTACLPPVFSDGCKRKVFFFVLLFFFFVGKKVSARRKWSVFGMFYFRFLLVFGAGGSHRRFNLRRTFFRLAVNEKSLSAKRIAYMRIGSAYMQFRCIFIQAYCSFTV
jgi:hypothetical protein